MIALIFVEEGYVMATSEKRPVYKITINEGPAVRLASIMEKAQYKEVSEFIIKAIDVFEYAVEAGGKIVVENERLGKRYVFKVTK